MHFILCCVFIQYLSLTASLPIIIEYQIGPKEALQPMDGSMLCHGGCNPQTSFISINIVHNRKNASGGKVVQGTYFVP